MISFPPPPLLSYQPGKAPMNYLTSNDAYWALSSSCPKNYFAVSAASVTHCSRAAAKPDAAGEWGQERHAQDQQRALAVLDDNPA